MRAIASIIAHSFSACFDRWFRRSCLCGCTGTIIIDITRMYNYTRKIDKKRVKIVKIDVVQRKKIIQVITCRVASRQVVAFHEIDRYVRFLLIVCSRRHRILNFDFRATSLFILTLSICEKKSTSLDDRYGTVRPNRAPHMTKN
jgi:hypothetical protein